MWTNKKIREEVLDQISNFPEGIGMDGFFGILDARGFYGLRHGRNSRILGIITALIREGKMRAEPVGFRIRMFPG